MAASIQSNSGSGVAAWTVTFRLTSPVAAVNRIILNRMFRWALPAFYGLVQSAFAGLFRWMSIDSLSGPITPQDLQ